MDESPKEIKQVVNSPVKHKKKTLGDKFAETFIASDVTSVKDYIIYDVLIPGLKDTISTIFHNSLDMLIFGSSRGSSYGRRPGTGTSSRTSYTRYYEERDRDYKRREEPRSSYSKKFNIDDFLFAYEDYDGDQRKTHKAAQDALFELQEVLDRYPTISVSEFYQIIGEPVDARNWTLNNYGWSRDDLSSADICRVSDGYLLKLPRPKSIK